MKKRRKKEQKKEGRKKTPRVEWYEDEFWFLQTRSGAIMVVESNGILHYYSILKFVIKKKK